MSNYICMFGDSDFTLPVRNYDAAVKAANEWEQNAYSSFAFVPSDTIAEYFECYGFEVEEDKTGITSLCFDGESNCDFDALFHVIAPFVTPGSYLTVSNGFNEIWRWFFDGETVLTIFPEIVFDMPEIKHKESVTA